MFLFSLLDGVTWYPILFDTPLNAVRSVAIWLTVLLVIAYLVGSLVLKRKGFSTLFKHGLIPYVCLLCALFLLLSFQEDGIETILFVPLFILLCTIAISAVFLYFKPKKTSFLLLGILNGVALIATLVCMSIHFLSGNAAEKNWLTNGDVDSITLTLSSCASLLFLLFCTFYFGKKEEKGFSSKSITFAAVCIGMSFALSYMRLVRLPQGGSITPASLLPLMLYGYIFGVKKGVFVGVTYGLLQALQDPSVLHPAQFLLDYPMAFAWMGLAGIFAKSKKLSNTPTLAFALGGGLAGLGRFAMHFLSGAFAFGYWAPSGTNVLLYSFLYQAGYVLPDLAIALIMGIALLSSKTFAKECKKLRI